jgi:hypothetical protein
MRVFPDDFYRRASHKSGRQSWCKWCQGFKGTRNLSAPLPPPEKKPETLDEIWERHIAKGVEDLRKLSLKK